MLVLATPELANEVLHAPAGTYLAGAANRRILPLLPENTVLTLDGEAHRARRRQLAPLFRGDSLDAIAPVIRGLASRELESWPIGRPFAVLPRMRSLTLRVAARVILGLAARQSGEVPEKDDRRVLAGKRREPHGAPLRIAEREVGEVIAGRHSHVCAISSSVIPRA
jgi:cytochrome P450